MSSFASTLGLESLQTTHNSQSDLQLGASCGHTVTAAGPAHPYCMPCGQHASLQTLEPYDYEQEEYEQLHEDDDWAHRGAPIRIDAAGRRMNRGRWSTVQRL